jgi:sugar lactone lactonase YvrE
MSKAERLGHARSFRRLLVAVILLLLAVGAAYAAADESTDPEVPSLSLIQAARAASADVAPQLTDPQVAEELPHHNLDRGQAIALLEGVFEPQLQTPAGIFDGLNVEAFLSNHAAIVPATIDSSNTAVSVGDPNGDAEGESVLLESTLPLRTEGPDGAEMVDLALEEVGGQLQPAAPLVEVGIPGELGEGISLPEANVQIDLAGAPEDRSPSIIEESVAAYPNVATDTDLAVAPTPTGVKTLTTLRGPQAPQTQIFHLDMPADAFLREHDGGAEVVEGDQTLVNIPRPSAIDAAGTPVPVSMSVSGDSLILNAQTTATTVWPALIDPLFESWSWANGVTTTAGGWTSSTTTSKLTPEFGGWGSQRYLWIVAGTGGYALNDVAVWEHLVPRFAEEKALGRYPTSFITHVTLQNLGFQTSSGPSSPFIFNGVYEPQTGKWAGKPGNETAWSYPGNAAKFENSTLNFEVGKAGERDQLAQGVYGLGMISEATTLSVSRSAVLGYAAVEIADEDLPTVANPSAATSWVNATATAPVTATATDTGLGVKTVKFEVPGQGTVSTTNPCVGTAASPCPLSWSSSLSTSQYDPSKMPQGEDKVTITAEDVLGNKVAGGNEVKALVKVDHTAPTIAPLSGTLTEHATLGTKRPNYTITATSSDGTEGAPQSGIYEAKAEVDGKVVATSTPKCATKNCASTINWTLEASKYTAGEHTLKVTATDAVGLSSTKELKFSLNPSPPSLSLAGTITEQTSLGTTRPRYILKTSASAEAGLEGGTPATAPTYSSAFGSAGTGNGQFAHPADLAIDKAGNLWVADELNNRLEVFNDKGEFVKVIGSAGSGNGQFSKPKSIAFDGKGNVWIADSGNNRLEELSEATGAFVKAVGSLGSGNAQFNGPESIAIDKAGNLWVADTYNYRIQKLSEKGEFLAVVNPGAMGAIEPTGIEVAAGNVWVADWTHNRVVEISEAGAWVRQFGSQGTGNGQFEHPDTVTVDFGGTVWVGDQNNGRVQGFNQSGEYLTKFGTKGSGAGQFSLSYPFGIATDAKGNLWVADANNNRVQKWSRPLASSEISTETTVNGKKVDSGSASCAAEKCPLGREWILPASSYAVGNYTVSVKATDGLGNTTTKSVVIEVQKDQTKPTIQLSGELPTAPEGWVEQDPYSFKADASDSGYGVTSLSLKIDGATLASTTGTCADGACPSMLSKGVDTSAYSGGAHTAVVTATDGAGNVGTKSWTVNIDPEGTITAEEATETLEAVEETLGGQAVAPASDWLEPEEIAAGVAGATLEHNGTNIVSKGTPDLTTIDPDPAGGLKIAGPEGELTVAPTDEPNGTSTAIASDAAAVQPNTEGSVDTVVRPEYNGALMFQAIRDSSSPEDFSWTVQIQPGQSLVAPSNLVAEVRYESGDTAFLIDTAPAHDAVGHGVPTSISVKGNVLTLHVEHHTGGVVYPVLTGQAYETGYSTVILSAPASEAGEEYADEPPVTETEPSANANPKSQPFWYLRGTKPEYAKVTESAPELEVPEHHVKHNWTAYSCSGTDENPCKYWEVELKGKYMKNFLIQGEENYSVNRIPQGECTLHLKTGFLGFRYVPFGDIWNTNWFGPVVAYHGGGQHLGAYCHYWLESWPAAVGDYSIEGLRECKGLVIWIWPNGHQRVFRKKWTGPGSHAACPNMI